jgi:hypothetical protein
MHRNLPDRRRRRLLGAGLAAAAWPLAGAHGDTAGAWPEELRDIETFTAGRVRPGDWIDADSIDLVQDLVDPILYQEVKQDGRRFFIQASEHAIESLFPPYFLDATLRHQGLARFDADGNVYTADGEPWPGGLPFPDARDGAEVIANLTLSWGRHDRALYAFPAVVVDADGAERYAYDFVWAEQQCAGLVHPDAAGPYLAGYTDKLRLQSLWFTHTNDVKGSAFLSIWPYDQRRIPELFGYLPNLKRVRRFPANQRFEPYMPGLNLYLSDAWAAGDPMLTWGNYRIIHRGPYLGSCHGQWRPERDNWVHPLVGGAGGISYFEVGKALVPEAIVLECEPVGYPTAPVSKRRLWVDARNMNVLQAITYDRQGEMWKGFETGSGQRRAGDTVELTRDGRVEWSFNWLISHDVQRHRVTRVTQARQCRGDWSTRLDPDLDLVSEFMTEQALRRMGT